LTTNEPSTGTVAIDEPARRKTIGQQALDFALKYGMIIVLVILVIVFSATTKAFFSAGNLADTLRSISIVTLIALGVTFSLVVNGFDLSVGSVSGLAVMLAMGMMVYNHQPTVVAIIVALAAGAVIGLLNAFFIVRVRIPDILATLGMLYLMQGVQLTYSKGFPIYKGVSLGEGKGTATGTIQHSFLAISQGHVVGIPISVVLMVVTVILVHLVLNNTRLGRFMYVSGGNPEAARLSGVRVGLMVTLAYLASGFLAGFGGIVLAARIGLGDTLAGTPFLLDSVAAAFIGYAFLGQGKPNAIGTFFGAIFMGVLLVGMTMLNVPYYMQDIFKGLVLIGALSLSFYLNKRKQAV
jgi:simple sugar transport system permease protein